MKRIWLAVMILVLLFACVRGPRPALHSVPARSENLILVQFFEFPPQIATNVRLGYIGNFGQLIAYDIQTSLKRNGFPKVIVVRPGEMLNGDILVRGSIIEVSGGNFSHRMFGELFGFGASEVRAVGELIDMRTGRPFTGFSFSSASRWNGLDNEASVRENLLAVGRQIAHLVAQYQ